MPVEIPLAAPFSTSDELRFRFKAADVGLGSLVEAGIDEFAIVDVGGGCDGCDTPVPPIATISVDRSGEDVVIDWTGDPAGGVRFVVYDLQGSTFDLQTAIGSTDGRTFVHSGAVASEQSFFYRVAPVDACGNLAAP